MLLAMIHSEQTDQGYYEQKVEVELLDITTSGSPIEFIKKTVAEHLQVCCASTGIPLGAGFWMVEFNPEARALFGLSEGITL